jgi:hypothetical protein
MTPHPRTLASIATHAYPDDIGDTSPWKFYECGCSYDLRSDAWDEFCAYHQGMEDASVQAAAEIELTRTEEDR